MPHCVPEQSVVVAQPSAVPLTSGNGTRHGSDAMSALFMGLAPPQHAPTTLPIMHSFTGTHVPAAQRYRTPLTYDVAAPDVHACTTTVPPVPPVSPLPPIPFAPPVAVPPFAS